ncbi:MAG: hypothetical protein ACRDSL_02075 [Pseudonocardiaceae bacterium]
MSAKARVDVTGRRHAGQHKMHPRSLPEDDDDHQPNARAVRMIFLEQTERHQAARAE